MPIPQEVIDARQAEVDQYDQNIAMYEAILATLPTEWPAHLESFKDRRDHQQAITECDSDDVELLSQLLYATQVAASIRTEKLERTKAASILAVLIAQTTAN